MVRANRHVNNDDFFLLIALILDSKVPSHWACETPQSCPWFPLLPESSLVTKHGSGGPWTSMHQVRFEIFLSLSSAFQVCCSWLLLSFTLSLGVSLWLLCCDWGLENVARSHSLRVDMKYSPVRGLVASQEALTDSSVYVQNAQVPVVFHLLSSPQPGRSISFAFDGMRENLILPAFLELYRGYIFPSLRFKILDLKILRSLAH